MMVSSKQEIKCPECGQRLNVPLSYTGLVGCPACKEKISIYEGSVQSEEVEVHSEEPAVERELELFESDSYMIRGQVFRTGFYAPKFYIYSDESMENLIGFSGGFSKKSWGGSIYSDESMSTELLEIDREDSLTKALVDANMGISRGIYSIADRQTGEELGSMSRKVLKSTLKESWAVVDPSGNEVGTLSEDIGKMRELGRLGNLRSTSIGGTGLSWLTPKMTLSMNGAPGEVTFSQIMNFKRGWPVVREWTVSGVLSSGIDPRLAAANALLVAGFSRAILQED